MNGRCVLNAAMLVCCYYWWRFGSKIFTARCPFWRQAADTTRWSYSFFILCKFWTGKGVTPFYVGPPTPVSVWTYRRCRSSQNTIRWRRLMEQDSGVVQGRLDGNVSRKLPRVWAHPEWIHGVRINLSLRFNGHFPGGPGLVGIVT